MQCSQKRTGFLNGYLHTENDSAKMQKDIEDGAAVEMTACEKIMNVCFFKIQVLYTLQDNYEKGTVWNYSHRYVCR
jgi:hypothetical protein